MKRLFYTSLTMLLTVVLSGCIQDTIVIHVKPDGSGTIDETSLLSNSMFDMMESIAGSMTGPSKEGGIQDNKDATKGGSAKEAKQTREDIIAKMANGAEKRAQTFGAKVKLVSAKPVATDTASGYKAVYAFQDINEVRVNQNPGARMDGEKTQSSVSPGDEYIVFKLIKGPSSKLVVTLPAQKETAGDKSSAQDSGKAEQSRLNEETSAQAPEMMKNLFQDLKIKISLQFEGTIINTNATYRDGSTVTLIEMDIGKIIGNGDLFKRMLTMNLQSVGETKASFKNVEGLRFETNNPLIVEFR
ncbi:MAG: hypothetical protein ACLP9S_10485 [Syntrophales bacterium]|jgi:hypothetical protein